MEHNTFSATTPWSSATSSHNNSAQRGNQAWNDAASVNISKASKRKAWSKWKNAREDLHSNLLACKRADFKPEADPPSRTPWKSWSKRTEVLSAQIQTICARNVHYSRRKHSRNHPWKNQKGQEFWNSCRWSCRRGCFVAVYNLPKVCKPRHGRG